MQSLAQEKPASGASARRRGDGQAGPRRRRRARERRPTPRPEPSRAATSMSAQRCLTAWNWPIGRPNCTRVRACSAAVSTHHWRRPSASAPASTPASSSTAASGDRRRRGRHADAVDARPRPPVGSGRSSSAPAPRRRPGRRGTRCGAPSTVDRQQQDVGHRCAPRRAAPSRHDERRRRQPVSERRRAAKPATPPRRQRRDDVGRRRPTGRAAVATIAVGSKGPGRQRGARPLEHDRQLGDPVPLTAALLRDGQPGPAQPSQLRPPLGHLVGAASRARRAPRPSASRAASQRAAVAASSRCSSLIASPVTVARPPGVGGRTARPRWRG